MQLTTHRQHWNELSEVDALWAILSRPEKRNCGWDLAEFFATGEQQIAGIMEQCRGLGYPKQMSSALDFGCGVGRLTRALEKYFDTSVGTDISEGMIRRARELTPQCSFACNSGDLSGFKDASFDFICSFIVLQHMPSRSLILNYLQEFLRLLKPGGVIVFQLPAHIPLRGRLQLRRRIWRILRPLGFSFASLFERGLAPMSMTAISEAEVCRFVESHGAQLLRVVHDELAGPGNQSRTYFLTRV